MDALVFVSGGAVGRWDIYARDPKDLLLGTIEEGDDQQLRVKTMVDPLRGLPEGPYSDLDAAMNAVAPGLEAVARSGCPNRPASATVSPAHGTGATQ